MDQSWSFAFNTIASLYNVTDTSSIPIQAIKSLWTARNKVGFFKGLFENAHSQDIEELSNLLRSEEFINCIPDQKIAQLDEILDAWIAGPKWAQNPKWSQILLGYF